MANDSGGDVHPSPSPSSSLKPQIVKISQNLLLMLHLMPLSRLAENIPAHQAAKEEPGARCCTAPFLLSPGVHLWCGRLAGSSHHTRCREKAMKASFSQDSQAISGRWLMVINGKRRFSLFRVSQQPAAADED